MSAWWEAFRPPPEAGWEAGPHGRELRIERAPDGTWQWTCRYRGATGGPFPGYASEDIARAAASQWYPLLEGLLKGAP